MKIKTANVDSNHAERDKHLRSDDFLAVEDFPEATFRRKKLVMKGGKKADDCQPANKEVVIKGDQ